MTARGTGRIGVHLVGRIVEANGWLFREQPVDDVGIDAHLEAPDALGCPSGRLIAVQIKAGASWFAEANDERVVYRGTARHRTYWEGYALPVLVILCDPDTGLCLWQRVCPETIVPTGEGWKLEIPRSQVIDDVALRQWVSLSGRPPPLDSYPQDSMLLHARAACETTLAKIGKKFRPDLYVQRGFDVEAWSFLSRTQSAHARAIVLIERAGSGKTNLLCALASRLVEDRKPLAFLIGSDPVRDRFSLFADLLGALGLDPDDARRPGLAQEHLRDRLAGRPLCVLVDAINETADAELMQAALQELFVQLKNLPARILVSCRDIYWTFLKGDWMEAVPCEIKATSLYRFDPDEWAIAAERYFRAFGVGGELTGDADQQCRHPLLLRFFCEAYAGEQIGVVSQIRLRPLFDRYLHKKVERVALARRSEWRAEETAIKVLEALARKLLESGETTIDEREVPALIGDPDHRQRDSLYLRLLDEDIIIDELVDAHSRGRRVQFVYEAFFEFMLARVLEQRWLNCDADVVVDEIVKMVGPLANNRNVLGALTYMDTFFEQRDILLWNQLAGHGSVFQRIILAGLTAAEPDKLPFALRSAYPRLVQSDDPGIRFAAIRLLETQAVRAQLDPGAKVACDRLTNDPVPQVRRVAMNVLDAQTDGLSLEQWVCLAQSALDPSNIVRREGRLLIAKYQARRAAMLPKLRDTFQPDLHEALMPNLRAAAVSPMVARRVAAIEALSWIRPPDSADLLRSALQDKSALVRKAALWHGDIRDQMSEADFSAVAEHPSPLLRRFAARRLGHHAKSRKALDKLLLRRLDAETHPLVVRRLLWHVSKDSSDAIQNRVIALLDQPDARVRRLATHALTSNFGLRHARPIIRSFLSYCEPETSWRLRWPALDQFSRSRPLPDFFASGFQGLEIEPEDAAFLVGLTLRDEFESPQTLQIALDALRNLPQPLAARLLGGIRRGDSYRILNLASFSETLEQLLGASNPELASDAAYLRAVHQCEPSLEVIDRVLKHPAVEVRTSFAWGMARMAGRHRDHVERLKRIDRFGDDLDDDVPF